MIVRYRTRAHTKRSSERRWIVTRRCLANGPGLHAHDQCSAIRAADVVALRSGVHVHVDANHERSGLTSVLGARTIAFYQ